MKTASLTDRGRVRPHNEDSCGIETAGAGRCRVYGLFLADGMGGHAAGDVASALFIQSAREVFSSWTPSFNTLQSRWTDLLYEIFSNANARIFAESAGSGKRGMGTTAVAGIACRGSLYCAWVGDSRLYLYRDHVLEQITTDHSMVQELVRAGRITPAEARVHPRRNVITRSVGIEENMDPPEVCRLDLRAGDVVLLCSDGLTGEIDDGRLLSLFNSFFTEREGREAGEPNADKTMVTGNSIRNSPDLAALAELLVSEANERGGNDNITVVLAEYPDDPGMAGGRAWKWIIAGMVVAVCAAVYLILYLTGMAGSPL